MHERAVQQHNVASLHRHCDVRAVGVARAVASSAVEAELVIVVGVADEAARAAIAVAMAAGHDPETAVGDVGTLQRPPEAEQIVGLVGARRDKRRVAVRRDNASDARALHDVHALHDARALEAEGAREGAHARRVRKGGESRVEAVQGVANLVDGGSGAVLLQEAGDGGGGFKEGWVVSRAVLLDGGKG